MRWDWYEIGIFVWSYERDTHACLFSRGSWIYWSICVKLWKRYAYLFFLYRFMDLSILGLWSRSFKKPSQFSKCMMEVRYIGWEKDMHDLCGIDLCLLLFVIIVVAYGWCSARWKHKYVYQIEVWCVT
jgi:hypothetical protein